MAEEVDPMAELRKSEKCSQTKEDFYRSQTLKSPASESSVYFDTVLRRSVDNQVPQGNGQQICLGSGKTPRSNLMEAESVKRLVYKREFDEPKIAKEKAEA